MRLADGLADEACMVRFFRLVVLAIVAVVILVLAFANRHFVTVSLDPFASGDNAAFSFSAPTEGPARLRFPHPPIGGTLHRPA